MSLEPIVLHGHAAGPNPWKVVIILEELEIPYNIVNWDFSDLKKEPYESMNPNGRVPTLQDPNTGIKVFESGAIIDYLLDTYDKSHRLSPASDLETTYALRSWRDFQMSGQGPYFGQAVWFTKYHPEDVESARNRYRKEAKRVIGVIDRHLDRQGTNYLTGNEVAHPDLMFTTWNNYLGLLLPDDTDVATEFPKFNAWNERIRARPAVAKVLSDWKNATDASSQ